MYKTLTKNITYKILHQIILFIFPLILTPYISRVLGVKSLGIYSFYYSISIYFSYLATLGINIYGNRAIAQVKENDKTLKKVFTNIYVLQFIASIISLLLYLIFILISKNKIISIIMIMNILTSLFNINWFYFGQEKFKSVIFTQLIIKTLITILIFVFVKNENSLIIYSILKCSSDLIFNIILFIFSIKYIKFNNISKTSVKNNLKPCLLLFIPALATTIYQQTDKVMIGILVNKTEVGYYECASKLITITLGLVSAVLTVISPKMSDLTSRKKDDDSKKLFNNSINYILCLATAISFGIISISKEFVPLFFGSSYKSSINLTINLAVSLLFVSFSNSLKLLYLIPKEKDKIYTNSVIYGTILNIILNYILISKYNAMGAVISTVLTELFVLIYQILKIKNNLNLHNIIKNLIIYIIFGIIMYSIVSLVATINMSLIYKTIVEILTGIIVYVTLCLIYFTKTKNKI
mgnify:CR=1 FL=1